MKVQVWSGNFKISELKENPIFRGGETIAIERMEKYNWKLSTKIIIGINGKPTSVSLHESYIMSVLKLTMMSQINSDVSETVNDILEKGEQFFVMDSQFTKEAIKKI